MNNQSAAISSAFSPLSKESLEQLKTSDQAMAEYLASLSPDQLRTFQKTLREDKSMPQPVQKTLLKLFSELEKEAKENEKMIAEAVLPLATGIAKAMKLWEQIKELENIERSLLSAS